jgi:hypothetical protein
MAKLSKEDYEYRRTENSVSSINYHFVFVPKRRKPVLIKDVAHRLQEIIFELVTGYMPLLFGYYSVTSARILYYPQLARRSEV